MAVEPRRGCGYRKVGGLYLVGEGSGMNCCKLPVILRVCPTCSQGIKQSRGWQWIDPRPWLASPCTSKTGWGRLCPASAPELLGERVGLLWVGAKFYPTPEDFTHEATTLGVSRRIQTVPCGFKVGETWVFFAHPKVQRLVSDATGEEEWLPGVFRIFRPAAIEKIITQTMSLDAELMKGLEERGITPVIVPDDDKDHQGSVYDDDTDELPLPEPEGSRPQRSAGP